MDVFDDLDLGAGYEPAQSAEAPTHDAGVSDGSPAAAEAQEPTDQGTATAPDQGDQDASDGTQQEAAPSKDPKDLSEEDLAEIERQAEAALDDERSPKFFTNALKNVYKPKLEKLGAQVEQYSSLGTPEEISERIGLLDKLGEIRTDPNTRMPIKSTEGFVQAVYEKDPEIAQQLMADLANMPADPNDPQGPKVIQALFSTMGIDPNRLDDIKQFAANGYQMQAAQYPAPDPDDLAQIPRELHATFGKLPIEVRDSLMSDNENVRNQNLEAHRYRIENEERQQSWEAQQREQQEAAQQRQQQEFAAKVDTEAETFFQQSGEATMDAFVESLVKQAGMSQFDGMMVTNTLLNSFEPTLAGRKTAEALKAAGVEIDPVIPPAIEKMQELSRHAAYYKLQGDKTALTGVVNQIADLRERIIAKGNKTIVALAKMRAGSVTKPVADQNAALAATATDRHAFNGSPFQNAAPAGQQPPRPNVNYEADDEFSDAAYARELRAGGFGTRQR